MQTLMVWVPNSYTQTPGSGGVCARPGALNLVFTSVKW